MAVGMVYGIGDSQQIGVPALAKAEKRGIGRGYRPRDVTFLEPGVATIAGVSWWSLYSAQDVINPFVGPVYD